MSKERVIKQSLKQIYIKLTIRRGLKENKLNRLQHECTRLEGILKPSVADDIANQAAHYLNMEEPDWKPSPNPS